MMQGGGGGVQVVMVMVMVIVMVIEMVSTISYLFGFHTVSVFRSWRQHQLQQLKSHCKW